MIWTRPWALGALAAPLGLLLLLLASRRWKAGLFRALGDEAVLRRLVDPRVFRHQALKGVMQTAALAFLAAALAGPRWGPAYQEVRRRGVDVMIAVDVSASMLAEDVKPNRLIQARRELGRLISGLGGDRVGVLAFAGSAFLQCPLTLDYGAAKLLLDLVGPDLIPDPGTNLAAAIEEAEAAFPPGSRGHRVLVLLTDGEDHSGRLPQAVEKAAASGTRILAVGFGSAEGEVIPLRDEAGGLTGYKKDRSGETVVSRLNEKDLRDMAERTGGKYYSAGLGDLEVERVLADIDAMEKKSLESRVHGNVKDRTAWPLALAILLLLIEFLWPEVPGHWGRLARAWRPAALLVLGAAAPLLGMGRAPTSRELGRAVERSPEDPEARFRLGLGQYRQGNHGAAAEAFDKAGTLVEDPGFKARAAYNSGNSLFRQEKWAEALEKYKQALRLDPSDMDAKHNLELTQRRLREQKEKKSRDKGEPKPDQGSGARPEPRPGELSKEDAERLLKAVEEQEKEARRKSKAPEARKPSTTQDW